MKAVINVAQLKKYVEPAAPTDELDPDDFDEDNLQEDELIPEEDSIPVVARNVVKPTKEKKRKKAKRLDQVEHDQEREDEELEEEWEVQDILDCRIRNGRKEYRILWKDYDIDAATWEPTEACENAEAKVITFHKEKGLWCETCKLKVFSKSGLKTHMKSEHSKQSIKTTGI